MHSQPNIWKMGGTVNLRYASFHFLGIKTSAIIRDNLIWNSVYSKDFFQFLNSCSRWCWTNNISIYPFSMGVNENEAYVSKIRSSMLICIYEHGLCGHSHRWSEAFEHILFTFVFIHSNVLIVLSPKVNLKACTYWWWLEFQL